MNLKIGFVTAVELGFACIEELIACGHPPKVVVTLDDIQAQKKVGRVYVDNLCAAHGIDLIKSPDANQPHVISQLQSHQLDWLFIVGWSQIAKADLLNVARLGALGMHPTLLPEGRGRAPIPWAIIKGVQQTGVTLFQLDDGVDSGPIIAQQVLSLAPNETATSLYARAKQSHTQLIRDVLPQLLRGHVVACPQDHQLASYWPQRKPADGEIHVHMGVHEVDRLVRGVTHPYPGAFFDEPNQSSRRIRIWAGHIEAQKQTQTQVVHTHANAAEVFPIQLRDGVYNATDWVVESNDS
jgi:methionyl-tRNA formyltransferase